jgi:hypothetical protein
MTAWHGVKIMKKLLRTGAVSSGVPPPGVEGSRAEHEAGNE